MGVVTIEIAPYLLAAGVIGLLIGWLLPGPQGKGRLSRLSGESRAKLHDALAQRDTLTGKVGDMQTTLDAQRAVVRTHEIKATISRTELEEVENKAKSLERDVMALQAERETFKSKLNTFQNALLKMKQHSRELQAEFVKAGDFYKGELAKSFEIRKQLSVKIDNAQYESATKTIEAKSRLGNLDALEMKIIELEADNAQLNHDASQTQREIEALQHDVADLDDLKVQNKELSHCLNSMENSRQQYETDARRFREQAGESAKMSDTLQIRLDEVEKNFADIESHQRDALSDVRKDTQAQKLNGQTPPPDEQDNLQDIIGIGKVFENALHELGVYTFEQIAAFGPTEIARVNTELKECRGRMEQDDWIGQAKELHAKKYGKAVDS